jgi:two-component system sensor kinase FixL
MDWLWSSPLQRCAKAAQRLLARSYAAPLPVRLSIAGATLTFAVALRFMSSSTLGPELVIGADYLAVGVAGLLGGAVPGACAALAIVLAAQLWPESASLGGQVAAAIFLANAALLLALEEAFHHVWRRLSAKAPGGAALSEDLASVALATPGVVATFFVTKNGQVAYRYVSPKATTVLGLDPDEICADAGVFFKRLSRDHVDAIYDRLFRSARDLSLCAVEFLFDHPEKGAIWMEAQAAPVRESSGLVVLHGYASDVTERKRVELSLAETAARLQATIDAAQDAVLLIDADRRIRTINRAGAAMFDYSEKDITGRRIDELLAPGKKGPNVHLGSGKSCAVQGRRRSGKAFPAGMTISETDLKGQSLRLVFIRDLTEQREFERELGELRRNRLDAMGSMAAALAHEINQPLAANATYLRVAQRLLEKSPNAGDAALIEILEKAAAQTLRAGRIMASVKDLARGGEPDKTRLGVHDVIREAAAAEVEDCERAEVKIELRCEAACDEVVADRTQLRQAIGNLIRNSAESMQFTARKELVISTRNPDDRTILVDVIDSGRGLPESSGIGFFEPFTTTKARGMGVGLSISKSIIESHYGRIWATPNSAGGAVFSFSLPLQESDVDA